MGPPGQGHAEVLDFFVAGQQGTPGNVHDQEDIPFLFGIFGYGEAEMWYAGYGAVKRTV